MNKILLKFLSIFIIIALLLGTSNFITYCMQQSNDFIMIDIDDTVRSAAFNKISCRRFVFNYDILLDHHRFIESINEWYGVYTNTSNHSIKNFALEHLCTLICDAEFSNEYASTTLEKAYNDYFRQVKGALMADTFDKDEFLLTAKLSNLTLNT